MNLSFLSTLSPLSLLVLLFFLFAIAVVVALWSLLTLGSSPRGVVVVHTPKVKKVDKPSRPNRFIRQHLGTPQTQQAEDDIASELPTDHVSRSRVRILRTLEPDPELEVPQVKPTTYDQMVKGQRVPKTGLPKPEAINTGLPKAAPSANRDTRSTPPRRLSTPSSTLPESQTPLNIPQPPRVPTPPRHTDAEDTSTQPSLFETSKRQVPPRQPQPSVQREESEAAFHASQGSTEPPVKPKTQKEKDDAFEQFLRKNDDLNF
jgi:hypothetical protein